MGEVLKPASILTRDMAPGNFPIEAFSFDPPDSAAPALVLNSPWSLSAASTAVGTAAALASANQVLAAGQIGYETDTKFFKIGDGSTAYANLMYQAQRNVEAAYTPSFQGFGTPTSVNFTWTRIGNRVKVMGQFTAGTTTGVEAQIGLPGGVSSDSALVPSAELCGHFAGNAAGAYGYCLIESAKAYVTFSAYDATHNPLSKILGTQFGTGQKYSFVFELPVSGWNA